LSKKTKYSVVVLLLSERKNNNNQKKKKKKSECFYSNLVEHHGFIGGDHISMKSRRILEKD